MDINELQKPLKNKKLFRTLQQKWSTDTLIDDEKIIYYYNRFEMLKNGFHINKPQIVTFLTRFDGTEHPEFDEKNLKDITKYSSEQIKSLISEYDVNDALVEVDIFASSDLKTTPEKIKESKKMWFDTNLATYYNNGLYVHFIPDQRNAIIFGYYMEHIYHKHVAKNNSWWCVAWRGDGYTNRWHIYRKEHKTFYFVMDVNRKPEDPYHMCALQVTNSMNGYVMTSLHNDGDKSKSWSDVIHIYPQLKTIRHLLEKKRFDAEKEMNATNKICRIQDLSASRPFYFPRITRKTKEEYIANNGLITKSISWKSMDKNLRNLYILNTRSNQVEEKFSTLSLIDEIKKSTAYENLLNKQLADINYGSLYSIIKLLLTNEFFEKNTIFETNYTLYKHKETGKYGIYDLQKNDWALIDGYIFKPEYDEIFFNIVETENSFISISGFSKNLNNMNEESFYILIPDKDNFTLKGHFITQKAWENEEIQLLDTIVNKKKEN